MAMREARGAHPAHPALGTPLSMGPISVGTIERHCESLDIVAVSVGPHSVTACLHFAPVDANMSKCRKVVFGMLGDVRNCSMFVAVFDNKLTAPDTRVESIEPGANRSLTMTVVSCCRR